jgi:hypothetical protein
MSIPETPGYRRIKQVTLNFVRARKLGPEPGVFEKERGGGESLYGSYHAAHILDIFGELKCLAPETIDRWSEQFQRKQTEQGYFSNRAEDRRRCRRIDQMDPVWHSTRGCLWALRILERKPARPLAFLDPLLELGALYRWVKRYDWSNPWAAGNQVLACATALLALRDWFGADLVDRLMERDLYPALEELFDERTGFWGTQFGCDLPTGLFGTIHITPIYFAQGWPLCGLERNADSTLQCQLADGSFWPGGSDCPDFDGAYMISNLAELTPYRREDLCQAARRYLRHALMHEDPHGCGWLLHRRDSTPQEWRPRPHFVWTEGQSQPQIEFRDDDPARTHIMLGSWFYPLSIALVAHLLGDTGYEGPYRLNRMSLHQCNAFQPP